MACGGFITLPSLRVRWLGLSDNRIRGSGEAFLNRLARKGTALPYCVAPQSAFAGRAFRGGGLGGFRVSKTSHTILQKLMRPADEAVTN
jgi:hypothetical protein